MAKARQGNKYRVKPTEKNQTKLVSTEKKEEELQNSTTNSKDCEKGVNQKPTTSKNLPLDIGINNDSLRPEKEIPKSSIRRRLMYYTETISPVDTQRMNCEESPHEEDGFELDFKILRHTIFGPMGKERSRSRYGRKSCAAAEIFLESGCGASLIIESIMSEMFPWRSINPNVGLLENQEDGEPDINCSCKRNGEMSSYETKNSATLSTLGIKQNGCEDELINEEKMDEELSDEELFSQNDDMYDLVTEDYPYPYGSGCLLSRYPYNVNVPVRDDILFSEGNEAMSEAHELMQTLTPKPDDRKKEIVLPAWKLINQATLISELKRELKTKKKSINAHPSASASKDSDTTLRRSSRLRENTEYAYSPSLYHHKTNREDNLDQDRNPELLQSDISNEPKETPLPEHEKACNSEVNLTSEGTQLENTEDVIFEMRHKKPLLEEKRQKRYDNMWQRSVIDRKNLQKVHEDFQDGIRSFKPGESSKKTEKTTYKDKTSQNPAPISLLPSLSDLKYIQVDDKLPVSAFGAVLPDVFLKLSELPDGRIPYALAPPLKPRPHPLKEKSPQSQDTTESSSSSSSSSSESSDTDSDVDLVPRPPKITNFSPGEIIVGNVKVSPLPTEGFKESFCCALPVHISENEELCLAYLCPAEPIQQSDEPVIPLAVPLIANRSRKKK